MAVVSYAWSARTVVVVVLLVVASTGAYVANMFIMMMIGEINRKRAETNLISYLGFTLPKVIRILTKNTTLLSERKTAHL